MGGALPIAIAVFIAKVCKMNREIGREQIDAYDNGFSALAVVVYRLFVHDERMSRQQDKDVLSTESLLQLLNRFQIIALGVQIFQICLL